MDTYYRSRSNGRFVFSADDLKDIENRDEFYAPVVVIDPEDREQVAALMTLYYRDINGQVVGVNGELVNTMQAALREFAAPTPPRPEEPTGLGAVVEAVCDCQPEPRRFVRDPDARDFNMSPGSKAARGVDVPWVSRCGHHRYDHLAAVTVLSEGVTQ